MKNPSMRSRLTAAGKTVATPRRRFADVVPLSLPLARQLGSLIMPHPLVRLAAKRLQSWQVISIGKEKGDKWQARRILSIAGNCILSAAGHTTATTRGDHFRIRSLL
jgi:hypothetical protein